ncbi:ABC transporter substrate-binding protein/permease [Klebsiella pneumoniae]
MKKLLIALAGAACLLSSVSAAQADQLQDIEKRGVIRIAVPQDFPPFGSVGTDLQPQGYDIDMARYLAKSMKLKLQLVPVTSANRVPYLQTDKVDLVISSLGKNAEREKVIDFSRAYAPFFLGVFGPKGAELKDAAALSGKSIGVTRGAVEDMVLTSVALFGVDVSAWTAASVTLTLYTSAFLLDIWFGSIRALPKGQWEASRCLGLSFGQTLYRVVAPQALRIAIAPTVGFAVQVIKGTALASIIGFVELTKAGTMLTNVTYQPFKVFALVALGYFILCYPLSRYSRYLENKFNASHHH